MDYYDLPDGTTFLISLKALIIKDRKILLLKSNSPAGINHPWELPGGLIEVNEEPEDALKREVFEETQLKISVGKPVKVSTKNYDHFTVKNGKVYKIRYIIIAFECSVGPGDPVLSSEHNSWRYFSKDELGSISISPYSFPAVQKFQT